MGCGGSKSVAVENSEPQPVSNDPKLKPIVNNSEPKPVVHKSRSSSISSSSSSSSASSVSSTHQVALTATPSVAPTATASIIDPVIPQVEPSAASVCIVTYDQIIQNNKENRNHSVWVPLKGSVYDICCMYNSLSSSIQQACQRKYPNEYLPRCSEILSKIRSSPSTYMYLISACKTLKVEGHLIGEAKDRNYIGKLKPQSDEERRQDINNHVASAIEGLKESTGKYSGSDREYLEARVDVLKQISSAPPEFGEAVKFSGLTDQAFPVPVGFKIDNLRLFLYKDYPAEQCYCAFEDFFENRPAEVDSNRSSYPLDSLTRQHISEHNAQHRDVAVWMPIKDKVYDVRGMYISLGPILRRKCKQEGPDIPKRHLIVREHIVRSSSFLRVLSESKLFKVGYKTLDEIKEKHFVGSLKKETNKEKEDDFRTETVKATEGVQEHLQKYSEGNDYIRHYLTATLNAYKNISAQYSTVITETIPSGDPNTTAFVVPKWFNPQTLRSFFTNNDTAFDTTVDVPEEQDWTHLWKPDIGDDHTAFTLYVRPWLNTWEPFNTEIEGEVAWSLIDLDICRNDQPIEAQLKLIETRSQRKDLNDKNRMKKRRKQLGKVFVNRHEELSEKRVLGQVESWVRNLEDNEKDLLTLVSNPEAVIARKSDLEPVTPSPVPRKITTVMKTKMKKHRQKIAKRFASFRVKHHRLEVENQTYSRHVEEWAKHLELNASALAELCRE